MFGDSFPGCVKISISAALCPLSELLDMLLNSNKTEKRSPGPNFSNTD